MRIAFPVGGRGDLDEHILEHFGHAPAFLLIDLDDEGKIIGMRRLDNPLQDQHEPGAIPDLLARGVNLLICGGLGRRAIEHLGRLGIEVVRGVSGSVRDALNLYLRGELRSADLRPRRKWGGCGEPQEGREGE